MRGTGTKLTIFTVFTVIITFWLASIIGNIQPLKDTYSVKARFSDATGILVGDLVKIAGVNIGKVTGFKVEAGEAIVTMQIDGSVELPQNVIVDMTFRNLLGQRVINLERPQVPSSNFLAEGEEIPLSQTNPALDITVVFNNLRPLINSTNPEDINTVARAVLEVFEGREGDLAESFGNLGEVASTLSARDDRLAQLIQDLNSLAKVLNRQSSDVRTGFNRFTEVMESLADVTPTIADVVDQLNGVSRKFGGVLVRNRANLDQELSDLAALLGIVNDNLGPLDKIAKNLKEVLLATARSQGYGKWWNLYVVNLCLEPAESPPLPAPLRCQR
jgi:phospholipid/cholesterol/gamma-HCH transport system substrate-binding protein